MLSSLCRHFKSSVTLRPWMMTMSTAAAAATPETIQVLKLNMLHDNPGAVKKVGLSKETSETTVMVNKWLLFGQSSFDPRYEKQLRTHAFPPPFPPTNDCIYHCIDQLFYERNVESVEGSEVPKEKHLVKVTRDKRLGRVEASHWALRVVRPNFSNCCPNGA